MKSKIIVSIISILVCMVVFWYLKIEDAKSPTLTTPASKDDLIIVDSPLPDSTIISPLKISGKARGSWYFEASFPVKLLDANGKQIAVAPAQAKSDWMTENYVPFELVLPFGIPTTETGTLVLEKDNPSGLPEHDNELRIPVRFSSYNKSGVSNNTTIKLYYYNPKLDQGIGGPQCSDNGLVAVNKTILKTTTPLHDAIRLLIKGTLSKEEKDTGLTTEFPLSGFELKTATINNGVAILTFYDPQNVTGGGSCRISILTKQIEATAKQFPSVKSVQFLPEELFQP